MNKYRILEVHWFQLKKDLHTLNDVNLIYALDEENNLINYRFITADLPENVLWHMSY